MTQEGEDVKPEDVKPKINLTISFEHQQVTVKTRPTASFSKLFKAAETRFNVQPGTFKFTFDGERILPEQTPADVDMEDGDIIEAHLGQQGGAL